MAVAMAAYALILQDPRPATSTRTFLDDAVPLWPLTVWLYLSPYAVGPLFVVGIDDGRFRRLLRRGVPLVALQLALFVVFPTAVERPALPEGPAGPSLRLLQWVYAVDVPRNAAPSGHVSLAIVLGFGAFFGSTGRRAAVAAWVVAVSLSILTTGQHHVVDLVTGALLGASTLAVAAFAERLGPRAPQ